MAGSARQAIATALMACANVGRFRNEEAFERVAHGDWVAEARFRSLVGVSRDELMRQEKLARMQAGIFPAVDLPT